MSILINRVGLNILLLSSISKSEAVLSRGPSILKSYSLLTEEQRKDLIRTALEAKQELKKKLNDTETILKSKNDELEMLRLKLDGNLLMVNGEEEAMRGDAIKYFPLYPKRKFREESASDVHFRLAGIVMSFTLLYFVLLMHG